MKTEQTRAGSSRKVFLCVSAVGAWALMGASASAEIDITACLREKSASGSAWYSVEPYGATVPYSTTPVSGAVDGVSGADAATSSGRALFTKKITVDGAEVYNPCDVQYAICPVGGTQLCAVVTSFALRRFQTGNDHDDLNRTPHRFSLLGSNDGVTWNVLYAAEEVEWSAETAVRTFEIPLSGRAPYVRYRFRLDASTASDNYVGYHELILNGDVMETMTWAGGSGDGWNLTDAVWTDGAGTAGAWRNGAQATFDREGTVAVDIAGEVSVKALHVRSADSFALSGGTLKLMQPVARLAVESPTAVSSALADADWQATAEQAQDLPTDHAWVKLWTDRDLSRLTITGADFHSSNYSKGAATVCHQRVSDGIVSVQFQFMYNSSNPLLCVIGEFKQVGNDVFARGACAGFSWADDRKIGDDFAERNNTSSLTSWNVMNIVASETGAPSSPLSFGLHAGGIADCRSGDFLPQSASNGKTGEAVLSWKNRRVEDVLAVHSFEFFDGATHRSDATVHHFVRSGDALTFQVQCNRSEYSNAENPRLCVKVELTQVGDDVHARAVYAKYRWFEAGTAPVPIDFDDVTGASTIRDGSHTSGYGVRALKLDFATRLRLTGPVATARDWEIEEGTLILGAPEVSYTNRAVGTGTLSFESLSGSQSVTYTGVCDCRLAVGDGTALTLPAGTVRSVPKAFFRGTSTISLQSGSSLSIGEVGFADDAVVNLEMPADAKAESLRIGTSASLDRPALSRFLVNGKPVFCQTADGWLDASDRGLILSIR